jgi:hypothetical protein
MVYSYRIHGLAMLISTIAMAHCQKKTYRGQDVSAIVNQEMSLNDGISLGDKSFLSISGGTHGLCFRWLAQKNDHWQQLGTVHLDRINPAHHHQTLNFPTSVRLHEQQFQEEHITYFLTTGYVARKRLFFHRMRCDHPGALDVKATLTPDGKVDAKSLRNNAPHTSQLWLLPFEAEVVNDQNSLIIEGEGELLLLWHLSDDHESAKSWQDLLHDYDPESDQAELNLSVVADALQEAARAQH